MEYFPAELTEAPLFEILVEFYIYRVRHDRQADNG